jgi:hypothetical protein
LPDRHSARRAEPHRETQLLHDLHSVIAYYVFRRLLVPYTE